ncbi:bacteriochlorophyll 4-vinyl reductase [Solibacillus sp. FSL R7-0668]|uniref:bacteriochlorophyll 4-vinyl reductase n=1 Tax=Solibacillus sp. FSL R7-0668 TaxID=2921688 RepID=UPI0030F733E4
MSKSESGTFELLLANALKLPGIKVNREEFLAKHFSSKVSSSQLVSIMELGPIEANVNKAVVDKVAKGLVNARTLTSTGASFAAGVPGGLAMAATIPADTVQFFGIALRMAQELGYLYGYEDFWDGDDINLEKINGDLVLFLGVMFGVGGSTAAIKLLSSKLSQQALKKIPQKALTKTIYYPIIKKTLGFIGVKVTKDTFAKSVSKAIPLLGGIVSGGITYASMSKMGNKLQYALANNLNLTEEDILNSYNELKKEHPDIIDIDFEEVTE